MFHHKIIDKLISHSFETVTSKVSCRQVLGDGEFGQWSEPSYLNNCHILVTARPQGGHAIFTLRFSKFLLLKQTYPSPKTIYL